MRLKGKLTLASNPKIKEANPEEGVQKVPT
jgi:hypothetical protein